MNIPEFEKTLIMNNLGIEKTFNELNDDFFDDIMKYFDFPLEDVKGTDSGDSGDDVIKDFPLNDVEENNPGGAGGEVWDFQKLEPPPVNVLAGLSSEFSSDFLSDDLVKCDSVSCDGSSQPNQQSSTTSTKASSSTSITLHSESADVKGSILFQTSSPVSVLESSSSSSAANPTAINTNLSFLVKRGRSKRSRRASTFNLQFTLPFISSTSSPSRGSNFLVGYESESESYLMEKPARKRQKKKRNLTLLSGSSEIKKSPSQQPVARKCMHCEVTRTPQWREGPMGPKTLCNACGVRYRSGRLLPEYRPAASPTFVPSLHSNSHKKVVEMRKNAKLLTTVTPPLSSIPPGMSFG